MAAPKSPKRTRRAPPGARGGVGKQLGLRARGQRGGWRAGAGRPRGSRTSTRIPHRTRERITRNEAAHVTVKVVPLGRSLRSARARMAIERIFAAEKRRKGFRLLHYAIRRDHIHLVCESDDTTALSRGVQRLGSRIARRLNRLWSRRGQLFADRFHGRVLRTPRELRNVLRYVLLNEHKDALAEEGRLLGGGLDPGSSAAWFDGWHPTVRPPPVDGRDPPVTSAVSWLARKGWRRHGLLLPGEIPAASEACWCVRGGARLGGATAIEPEVV
jgi:putative transposase